MIHVFEENESPLSFPDIDKTHPSGVIALNGRVCAENILEAYKRGIFPWFSPDEPVLWWCPEPRFVLFPEKLKVAKSARPLLNKKAFNITINQNFTEVIEHCEKVKRRDQEGTWITPEIKKAYTDLHLGGYAYSVEVWQDQKLVGGLYGVWIGKVFFGESMFSLVSNASKIGFILWVKQLRENGVRLIDCQVYTDYLASFGAEMIARKDFISLLKEYI